MSDNIFREKSLKKISSPEDLNEYVKVANPGIWVLLISVIFLLLGFIAWGYFGKIDTSVNSFAIINNNKGLTYVKEEYIKDVTDASFIEIDNNDCEITNVSKLPIQVDGSVDGTYLHLAGFEVGDWVYEIEFNANIQNGTYESKIITERVKPITLLFE